jgi:hypothetical protein
MSDQFFNVIPEPAKEVPRGVTPFGSECCEKIRKMLHYDKRVPLLERRPGEDDDEGEGVINQE